VMILKRAGALRRLAVSAGKCTALFFPAWTPDTGIPTFPLSPSTMKGEMLQWKTTLLAIGGKRGTRRDVADLLRAERRTGAKGPGPGLDRTAAGPRLKSAGLAARSTGAGRDSAAHQGDPGGTCAKSGMTGQNCARTCRILGDLRVYREDRAELQEGFT